MGLCVLDPLMIDTVLQNIYADAQLQAQPQAPVLRHVLLASMTQDSTVIFCLMTMMRSMPCCTSVLPYKSQICDLSPTMSCQWASVNSGLWCSSDLVLMLCPLSRAVLPGQPSHATFAGAPFAIHRLWAMSSIVCLIALISVTSGPNFLACSKMRSGACVCSCGTRTRSLSAIVSLPCCRRLRHEHKPVLIR